MKHEPAIHRKRRRRFLSVVPGAWPLVLAALLLPVPVHGEEEPSSEAPPSGLLLTADRAVELALARPAIQELVEAQVGSSTSRAEARSLWDNPSIDVGWEQLVTPASEFEGVVALSQRFDVSGKRELLKEASEQRAESARIAGEHREEAIANEVRRRFYRALHAQSAHDAMVQRYARLNHTLEVVALREEAGDASDYERRRVQREVRLAQAEIDVAAAERDSAWLELTALMGDEVGQEVPSGWPRLTGELLPEAPPPDDPAASLEIRRLESETTAAKLEADAAQRQWIPEFAVRAGYRFVHTDQTFHGFIAGVSVPLPFWNNGDAHSDASVYEAAALEAESSLLEQERTDTLDALRTRYELLTDAAADFQAALAASENLVETAELSYGGGELGLIDVLDAHNAAIDDRIRLLSMKLDARMAALDYNLAAVGGSH